MIKTILAQAAVFASLAFCSQAYGAAISLTLNPTSGAIGGEPGSTVGWGFDIVNNTTDNLLIDGSYFCEAGEDPVEGPDYSCGANSAVGAYTDYIANNTGIITPGETIEAFDGVSQGFGEYSINPSVAAGSTDSGTLVLVYDVYSSDLSTELAENQELTASATVTATPEPAATSLMLGGLLLLSVAAGVRRHL